MESGELSFRLPYYLRQHYLDQVIGYDLSLHLLRQNGKAPLIRCKLSQRFFCAK